MKKIDSGLIKNVFQGENGKIIKKIKTVPKDRYGNRVSKKMVNENMTRAIQYNAEKEKVFAETGKIKTGEYEQEILFPIEYSEANHEKKMAFAQKLINMMNAEFIMIDGIQTMQDKEGNIFIADLDSFAVADGGFKRELLGQFSYKISIEFGRMGIADTITNYCCPKTVNEQWEEIQGERK